MVGIRHFPAFIQNTIKPCMEEIDRILGKCEHLNVSKDDLRKIIDLWVRIELIKTFCYCFTYIVLGVFFCLIVYVVLV